MKSSLATCLVAVCSSASLFGVAQAHHSFATHYDASRSMQLSGVVAKYDFRSPHSFIFVDVASDAGDVTRFEVELHSVPVLTRMGFSRDTFKPGDRITVNAWPNRSPTNPLVFGIGVTTADGVALGEFPPIATVKSAYVSAASVERIQGRWQVPRPEEPASFERPMSLTPAALAAVQSYDPKESPANLCEPYNVPAAFLTPYLFDIRLTDREAIVRHEAYGITRRVPFGPDAQVEPTGLFGIAHARTEGDTLVIESRDYPPSAWGLATAVDENGLGADIPSSAQKSTVERFSVSADGLTLTVQYELEDPVYLAERFMGSATLERVSDDSPMYEFECELDSAARFSTE